MPINSRTKGKTGELELAAFLRARGHDARRGQQFSGGADSPDVVSTSLAGFHLECKRVESGSLYKWLDQAVNDAGWEKVPIVAHRKNREGWVAIMRLDDLLALIDRGQKYHANCEHAGH